MSRAKVHINKMRLCVPGLNREQARRLGECVAKCLADLSPATQSRIISAAKLRVRSSGNSIDQMARDIALNISKSYG
jgi:hypothetical protein